MIRLLSFQARNKHDVIAESIAGDRDDAIVVAHSASGLFLPLVPERRWVRRLGFLAAVVPRIEKSLMDQVKGGKNMLNPEWIVCSEDRTLQPEWSRCAARERLGADPIELPGGHCPHVSRPGELAEVLGALDSFR